MSHRPTDWHVLDLEGDPVPGDPQRVRKLARELHDFAEDVGTALRQIRAMAGEDTLQRWSGKSANKFKEQFDGVPGNLTKLRTSYDLAGDAFADYWPKLERAQSLADRALVKGREAREDLNAAQGRLDGATDWVKTATAKTKAYDDAKGPEAPDESKVRAATRNAQQANSARSSAQGDVDSAQSALDAAKAMAQEARELREDAARVCKDKLDEASDAGIQNRDWWEDAVNFVTENWDAIVAVCKVVVAVVGVIAMIVGGPILAAIVVVAALVVLADTLNKYRKGQASLFDVGMAALDCIPGMKGLTTLGGLAKGVKALGKTGLKGMALGAKGMAKSVRGRGREMKSLVCRTDPIDMATGEMVMSATDVELPGVLPLVLQRHHRTRIRKGQYFGPSWTSTLDQRLLLDGTGLRFITEDGMELHYPVPEPDLSILPVEGPRWPLTWDGTTQGTLNIHRPDTGQTLAFRPQPNRPAHELALTEIRDRRGNTIAVHYQPDGTPGEIVHHGGYRIGVTTDSGHVTALTLLSAPDQPTLLRYAYDDHGNLTEVYNSADRPLTFTYDEAGRITGWQDRNDTWYRYTYENGRCVATEGADGFLNSSIVYDTENRRTLFTDALGNTTVYEFNDSYQLVREQDPLGNETHRTHDRYDRLQSITDPLGHTTRYTYDEQGRPAAVTRPDGHTITVTYNELGLPVETVDADGAIWRHEYDTWGNRTALIDPAGATTRCTYTAAGYLSTISDALGNTTRVTCDPAGLPQYVEGPLGNTTSYHRDPFGRPTTVTDALGAVTRLEWTPEGKLARQQDPDGAAQSWTYDGEGNCITHTDALGQTTTYEYTGFDVLAARTDPDGTRHTFTYDHELRLREVTNPQGLRWTYGYDPAGRLTAETDFDDRTITYTHDRAGRTTSRTTPLGDVIRYTHDALGQVTAKNAAGTITSYAYDPAGRLITAANPDHELTLAYDAAGHLTAESTNGRTVTHTYDALGRPVGRTTPTGVTTTYTHDPAGNRTELVTATGHTLTFSHDAAGRELLRRLDDGTPTIAHTWDTIGRLIQKRLAAGADSVGTRDYHYRADGHLTSLDDSRTGSSHYALDPVGRVTGVSAPDWSETYAYDTAGNQTAANWPEIHPDAEVCGERTYTGTRIDAAGDVRYEHDAAGRLTLRQKTRLSRKPDTWRYTWNAENQLTEVTTPDGTRWRYTYDPLGRRISKQRLATDGESTAEETWFTWHGPTLIEQTTTSADGSGTQTLTWEHDESGLTPLAQTDRYAPAADAPQAEIDTAFYAIVTDQIGTPTELLTESGEIAWQARTTLWGTTTWNADATAYTPLRFPGQYHDLETDHHYNLHRHYDPTTARYLTPDPLGLVPAPNPVAYVRNPHTWSDPLGLAPCVGSGNAYSVAYETYIPAQFFPGRSRGAHFQEANRALVREMDASPDFARMMDNLIPGIRDELVGPRGGISRRSPTDWTWHHAANPGQMQLVPRVQHSAAGRLQELFHPGGVGGYSIWG
ncbi:DUF6531 domain-containing protein [Streptomyces sp. NPDC002851]